jgi:hypothetical protein
MRNLIDALEPRRMLSSDFSVAFRSTSLPDTLVAGIAAKPAVLLAQVAATGDAYARTEPDLTLTAELVPAAGGDAVQVGLLRIKSGTLKATAKSASVKLVIPTSLQAGTYTLRVRGTGPADSNADNNAATAKTVTVASPSEDVEVVATTTAAATLASGGSVSIRAGVKNVGNIPAKGTATLEYTATRNGVTTVLGTPQALRLNVLVGKVFSAKPITVAIPGTAGGDTQVTIGARLVNIVDLTGDSAGNNAGVARTVAVAPPPVSVFTAANGSVPVASTITFTRTFREGGLGNFIERGTFIDSNGFRGVYDYRTVTAGIVRNGIVFSREDGVTPIFTGDFDRALGSLGGRTLTFSTTQAGSFASIAALGTTFFIRNGR